MSNYRMCGMLAALALCLPVSAMAQQVGSGAVALTGPGAGASEDFDTLASSGTTGTMLPTGWYFAEGGSNSDSIYGISDGSINNMPGNTYSLGTNGSSDRAFGSMYSGSLTPNIGARLQNATPAALSEIAISYTGEQWRLGVTNRTSPDRLDFEFSTNASTLLDQSATWTPVPELSFSSPITSGTVGALDGNLAANQQLISGTISGFSLQPGDSLWIRWKDINGADGADDALAIDDVVFGTPGDAPPRVTSIVPASDALEVPNDTDIVVTFNEVVTVDPLGITLSCGSANISISVSTISNETTITPGSVLDDGAHCTLSILAEAVADFADPPQAMLSDYNSSFTVFDPANNAAPAVASTVPVQDSSNFSPTATLSVTFTEAVTFVSEPFVLSCDATPDIELLAAHAEGFSYDLAPDTFLEPGDACTLTILAEGVLDLFGKPMESDFTLNFHVAIPAGPSDYYQNVNLATPGTLRCSIYDTIKGHNKLSYSYSELNLADQDPNEEDNILDHFKNESYPKQTSGAANYNREHTWPRSYGLGETGTPGPATDNHMLHLTNVEYNSARGNKPFANCNSGCTRLPTTKTYGIGGNSDADSNWHNGNSFEVWDHIKGNMARAVMYMAARYQGESGEPHLELTDNRSLITGGGSGGKHYMGVLTDLLEWNSFDAPDERELNRNQIVFNFQNNRNPFIDHPEWARRELFETPRPASCSLNLNDPVAAADSYAVATDAVLSIAAANGVLANDSDVEFDAASGAPAGWFTLTASNVSAPANGNVSLSADGSFNYTPNAGFCGSDSFTYQTSDGTRRSAPATVTIAVGSDCGTPQPEDAIFADGFEAQD